MVAVPKTIGHTAPDGGTAMPTTLPATLDAWAAAPDSLAWPAPFPVIIRPLADVYRNYLDATVAIEDADARGVVLLGRRAMPVMALVQFALWTEAARRNGQRLAGHPLLDYLAGAGPLPATALQPIGQPVVGTRWRWPRRLARTRSWTPLLRMPTAMLSPEGAALTHNSLLREYLRHRPEAVRNAYDEDFARFDSEEARAFAKRIDTDALADRMTSLLTKDIAISDDVSARLVGAIRPVLRESYRDAAALSGRLRATRHLPRTLFTGTGGKRMSRALGLEVIRRGGEVIRCDHGGSFVLLHTPDYMAVNELSVSTRFVVATPRAAESEELRASQRRAAPLADCAVEGLHGDAGLDVGPAAFARAKPAASGRRRAMYVSTLLYGMHQVSPPVLPAPLYIDWQARLIALLATMPIELLCKPHPGGLSPPAGLDPVRNVRVVTARFEQAVAEADVLIYDFPATTTLAVGLCTDRPIVLIDHGTMRFSASLAHEIAARCRIVPTTYDGRNRPVADRAALEEAVCGGPTSADPSFFRHLFLGAP